MDILSKIISKKIDELNQLKRSISISDLESSEFFERNNISIVNGLIKKTHKVGGNELVQMDQFKDHVQDQIQMVMVTEMDRNRNVCQIARFVN